MGEAPGGVAGPMRSAALLAAIALAILVAVAWAGGPGIP
jgi:hypothetical protein